MLAANVDAVFLLMSLNEDFNLRRLERYITMAWESGAQPVVILTKTDLYPEFELRVLEVEAISFGVPVHAISSLTGDGLELVRAHLAPGRTIALLGSSGVGKSTLVNTLAGEEVLATQPIREDDGEGRHTTTHRQLVLLPGGGLVLDSPGMRELQLWESSDGLAETFGDVEDLAAQCRFSDCAHETEPGCAVQAALDDGTLASRSLDELQQAAARARPPRAAARQAAPGRGEEALGQGRRQGARTCERRGGARGRHSPLPGVTVVVNAQSVAGSSVSLPFGLRAERSRDRVRVGHVVRQRRSLDERVRERRR